MQVGMFFKALLQDISTAEGVWEISQGAAVLFATNLVAVILGAAFIYSRLGIQGSRLGRGLPLWGRRTVLFLLAVILTAPLGYRLAHQLQEGQACPIVLPVSQSVRKAIIEHVHQQHGVTHIGSMGTGIEHKLDMLILLSAAKPVSAEFISNLKQVVNEAMDENASVAVHILQEAEVERTEF
jgi:hypothetical protein